MKLAFVALLALVFSVPAIAKELFAARCVPALTEGEFVWRVDESPGGVLVRYSEPKKKFSAEVGGVAAGALRAKIDGLRLSSDDTAMLRSREIRTADGRVLLRPFDGVTYQFSTPNEGVVTIDNPSFDLEYQPTLEATIRLRQVLELLEQLRRIAKKEKEANQSLESTATVVTLPAAQEPRRP